MATSPDLLHVAPQRTPGLFSLSFWQIALAAFGLRLVAAPWTAHSGDLNTFIAWGKRLAQLGPANFWTDGWWCDYLPGYLLVLWLFGEIAAYVPPAAHWLLFKIPNLLADVVTAWIIWRSTRDKLGPRGVWLPAAYLFNPAVLLNSTFWGQADSFHALGLVGGLYLLTRRHVIWAGAVLGFSLAIKPHSLVVLPVAAVFALRQKLGWWRSAGGALLVPLVFAATFLPFNSCSVAGLVEFIPARYQATMGQYGLATVNALNLWYLTGHNWQSDSQELLFGLTFRNIANLLCIAGLLAVIVRYWRQRRDATSGIWEAAALSYLVVFLFVTRAHERHVFPYFGLLAIAVAWRRAAIVPWALLSAAYCINLALAWKYLHNTERSTQLCAAPIGAALCLFNLSLLPLSVLACQRWGQGLFDRLRRKQPQDPAPLAPWLWVQRYGRFALLGVVLFAFTTRAARLNDPPKRYFDEVYHAFTAEQWVKGNTQAWLWNQKSPEKGCSYEWTHPPLAKLFMAASLKTFGIHPWAWRLPCVIFGTLGVLLIHSIALALFKHRGIALLAAVFAALDVLPLFSSRIGMNDVYCVTFILLAVRLALGQGRCRFLAPLAVGLALACKWTALYALPLLGFVHLVGALSLSRSRRMNELGRLLVLAALYLVIVPATYMSAYIPFFRAGHSGAQFVELQRQMWFYHTGLKATHPYSSPAWQWPLLSKPVWCHTDKIDATTGAPPPSATPTRARPAGAAADPTADVTTTALDDSNALAQKPPAPRLWIANVYAWGNPIIWCTGLGAVLFCAYHIGARRDPPVIIVLAGYLAFWFPWLMSPRIMFLYHYLPSLPFLYIALAWALVSTGVSRRIITVLVVVSAVAFLLIYPYVTAVYLPQALTPTGWR